MSSASVEPAEDTAISGPLRNRERACRHSGGGEVMLPRKGKEREGDFRDGSRVGKAKGIVCSEVQCAGRKIELIHMLWF